MKQSGRTIKEDIFVGRNSILSRPELEECIMLNASSENIDFIIQVLCEMIFLGLEINEDQFEYYSDKTSRKNNKQVSYQTFGAHR